MRKNRVGFKLSKFAEKYSYFIVCLAAAFVFSLPLILRILQGNNTLIGEYAYHHLYVAKQNSFSDLFSFVLAVLNLPLIGYWVFSIILSVIAVLLLYRLVLINSKSKSFALVAAMLFIVTPASIYMSSFLTPYLLATALLLAALNLFHSKNNFISLLPLAGLLFFDWFVFLSSLIVIFCYLSFIVHEKKRVFVAFFLMGFVLVDLLLSRPLLLEVMRGLASGTTKLIEFEVLPYKLSFVDLVSDFGAIHGLGIFVLLLSLLGFALSWRRKKDFVFAYLAAGAFFVMLIFFGRHVILFLSPILILFASVAFVYFWKREWGLSAVRFLTVAVLVYGVIFSAVAYVDRIAELQPNNAVVEGLEWLKQNVASSEVVLSHPQKSFWISYGSGLNVFNTYFDQDYNEKLFISNDIFFSRDFKKTAALLERNGITIIWIDKEMKSGQVWKESEEGLLYLFRNERFKKIYENEEVEVWRFKKS